MAKWLGSVILFIGLCIFLPILNYFELIYSFPDVESGVSHGLTVEYVISLYVDFSSTILGLTVGLIVFVGYFIGQVYSKSANLSIISYVYLFMFVIFQLISLNYAYILRIDIADMVSGEVVSFDHMVDILVIQSIFLYVSFCSLVCLCFVGYMKR